MSIKKSQKAGKSREGRSEKYIVEHDEEQEIIELAAYKLTEKQIKEIREELSKAFSVKYIRVEADTMRIVIEDAAYGDLEKLEKMGWRWG